MTFPFIGDTASGAWFSDCREHRFTLWRRWVANCPLYRMCAFIGLNPSTADEVENDPTIRRCIQFSKDWGFDGYVMLNLFSLRATDPAVMKAHKTPNLEWNDDAIDAVARQVGRVVVSWGAHGTHRDRDRYVLAMLLGRDHVHHLGLNANGTPKHPLYLRGDTQPVRWSWPQ